VTPDAEMTPPDPLLALLDPEPDRAAEKYALLRQRLVKFFQWRNCQAPEDLAQDTLRRGFARVSEGVEIYADPIHYFFGIAKNIVKEQRNTPVREVPADLDALPPPANVDYRHADARIHLGQCLKRLPPAEQTLLVEYYLGDREALARQLDLTAIALRVRVFRAKQKLEKLMQEADACAGFEKQNALSDHLPERGRSDRHP